MVVHPTKGKGKELKVVSPVKSSSSKTVPPSKVEDDSADAMDVDEEERPKAKPKPKPKPKAAKDAEEGPAKKKQKTAD